MPPDPDRIMEAASAALARMDYLSCEDGCVEALAVARQRRDWPCYARILMPLQEARRQRRMIAADGVVRLGSAGLEGRAEQWPARIGAGCLLLTQPHTPEDACAAAQAARAQRRHVEILYAASPVHAPTWSIHAFRGPRVTCPRPAPPADLVGRWLRAAPGPDGTEGSPPGAAELKGRAAAADFFLDACEGLATPRWPPSRPRRAAPGASPPSSSVSRSWWITRSFTSASPKPPAKPTAPIADPSGAGGSAMTARTCTGRGTRPCPQRMET